MDGPTVYAATHLPLVNQLVISAAILSACLSTVSVTSIRISGE